MAEIELIKDKLIDELWLPIAMKGGSTLYPRLRINKQMKMLTLTNDLNFREATEFVRNKLTKKELIIGWNKARNTALRLDSEGKIGTVFGGTKYEDSIVLGGHEIQTNFPFDIINLDFSSQHPEVEDRRLENEIYSIEHTMNLQITKGNKSMILLYTTLLGSKPLNLNQIKKNSDNIRVQGWNELSINGLPSTIIDYNEKISCLNEIFRQVCLKYIYEKIEDCKKSYMLSNGSGYILSMAVVLKKS